jgi:hypothetical protein
MFLKHLLIHYVIIMMKIVIFEVVKYFSIEDVDGLSVVFTVFFYK